MILVYIILFLILLPFVIFFLLSTFLPMIIRAKFGKMSNRRNVDEDGEIGRGRQKKHDHQETIHFNSNKGGEYTNFEEIDDVTNRR